MHIANHFVSTPVSLATAVTAAGGLLYAGRGMMQAGRGKAKATALTAAFIFAAQMINFPCLPGASGHLLGAGLAVALLGLAPGMVAMAAVVITQSLIFADGGFAVLGANLTNMALAGPVAAACVLSLFKQRNAFVHFITAAAAMFVAAGFCAAELALSGTAPLAALPSFMGVHLVIAAFEGVITAAVLAAVKNTQTVAAPEAVTQPRGQRALALVALLAMLAAPFASAWPDGLEFILGKYGVEPTQPAPAIAAWFETTWFADYAIRGNDGLLATWAVALGGTLLVFGAVWALSRMLVQKTSAA